MASQSRTLFSNTGALFAIQIANYILPFLLIPYLTHTLGAPLYGIIAFGLAMVQIACVFTDFGFGLSATYQIAKQQSDKPALRKIISAVFMCKLGLLIPVLCLVIAFISLQDKYQDYETFLWLLILPVIGQTFQPIWFFQGIERMTFITIYTVLSRTLYLGLVVYWVSGPEDYYWVAIANGISSVVAAAMGIAMMLRVGYWPQWCGWGIVKKTFRDSSEFFWARAAVATYTAGGAFFLGLVSSPIQVAYYSAAEQLYKGAQSLFSPVSQALYPHMAKHQNFALFFRIFKAVIFLGFAGLIGGILLGPWAIELIFGQEFSASYTVLVIFMLTFVVTTPSVLLGYPFLGALGNSRAANVSVMWAGLAQVALLTACYFLEFHQAWQIALSVLIVEIMVLVFRAKCSIDIYHSRILIKESL
ncbi:oligosaccharide flippase family protein [Pseudomonas sp. LB3P31]